MNLISNKLLEIKIFCKSKLHGIGYGYFKICSETASIRKLLIYNDIFENIIFKTDFVISFDLPFVCGISFDTIIRFTMHLLRENKD